MAKIGPRYVLLMDSVFKITARTGQEEKQCSNKFMRA